MICGRLQIFPDCRKDLVIVQSYMDAVDTITSQQQYDLRALIDFSASTVIKQQEDFKRMRATCLTHVDKMQQKSQEVR